MLREKKKHATKFQRILAENTSSGRKKAMEYLKLVVSLHGWHGLTHKQGCRPAQESND